MRIVLLGCVEFSARVLKALIVSGAVEIAGVATKAHSSFNADFVSLSPIARELGVPCFVDSGNDQDTMRQWLQQLQPDALFCMGWPYLLHADVLAVPAGGAIGYHPAELPHNRGRHPIIWALALGLEQTASTFFQMVPAADAGPGPSQRRIPIEHCDDARSLYDKLTSAAEQQIVELVREITSRTLEPKPQDLAAGNVWRKRGSGDGLIDWRMGADSIYNLVRALTRPYVGAHCVYRGRDVKVWRAAVGDKPPRNIEPGKVIGLQGAEVTVKVADGSVVLLEHEFPELPIVGDYL